MVFTKSHNALWVIDTLEVGVVKLNHGGQWGSYMLDSIWALRWVYPNSFGSWDSLWEKSLSTLGPNKASFGTCRIIEKTKDRALKGVRFAQVEAVTVCCPRRPRWRSASWTTPRCFRTLQSECPCGVCLVQPSHNRPAERSNQEIPCWG